jgi:hypothetical protein
MEPVTGTGPHPFESPRALNIILPKGYVGNKVKKCLTFEMKLCKIPKEGESRLLGLLFGSIVRGKITDGDDIHLLIEFDGTNSLLHLAGLQS